jgi:DNA mismatch endonuclease (patch repair protein)
VLLVSGESINKRQDNMARDKRVNRQLRRQGWKVIRIWQHSLKKSPDACLNSIRRAVAEALAI